MRKIINISALTFIALVLFVSSVALARASVTTGDANANSDVENVINTTGNNCDCQTTLTPTPTQVTPTPTEVTPTPTTTQVTPTPTETPSNDKGGGGNPGPSSCTDQKPGAGPFNLHAVAGPGAGQVTLYWEPAQGSVTGYAISYSDDPNNKKYGVANAGNVTSFTISDLAVTKYYFWVTPLNGCAPGEPVGPVSVGGTGGPIKAVLGLSSTGSDQNLILYFAQIFAAFALSIVGFKFFKKNA